MAANVKADVRLKSQKTPGTNRRVFCHFCEAAPALSIAPSDALTASALERTWSTLGAHWERTWSALGYTSALLPYRVG